MGIRYTTQSANGYNSSPPSDDGTQAASNLVTWAKHKTKLSDPIKNQVDAINTALVNAFDYSPRQITVSDTTVASDHMKCVEIAPTVTTAVTVSLGDATTMTSNYRVFVKNSSARAQTLGVITSGDTLDGTANGTVILQPGYGVIVQTNSGATGYLVFCKSEWSTGDVKLTLKTTADTGWVLMDDKTIGDASSGATGRANADTSALFTLLWTNTADADCAVSTGRGGSAAADFAAHKTIALPKALGRSLAVYGAGSGLTSRALAHIVGEETHTLTQAELPNYTLPTNNVTGISGSGAVGLAGGASAATTVSVTSGGSGTAFNQMQPTVFLNVMIKL